MTNAPLLDAAARVCSLEGCGITARLEVFKAFVRHASSVRPMDGGVRLEFARRAANRIAVLAFMRVERECCARFTYRFVDTAPDPFALEITAQPPDLDDLRVLYLGIDRG